MSHVRKAEEKDLASVLRLLVQVNMVHHNGRPDLFKGPVTKYTADELRAIFQDPKTPVFVCTDDAGAVQGYIMCVFKRHVNDNLMTDIQTLYIDDLCVDETLRGSGVGRALYEYVVAFAKESGCYNVTLNVWTLNPSAMRFYEKLGMKPRRIEMEHILPDAPLKSAQPALSEKFPPERLRVPKALLGRAPRNAERGN